MENKDYVVTIPAEVLAAAAEEDQDISIELSLKIKSK